MAAPRTTRFYEPANYRPDESVAYLMRQILNAAAAEAGRELAPSGLTNAQWIPLYKLYIGEANSVAGLARECRVDTGAMTRTLDRLEAKGLLARERSSGDRRVVNIALTPEGRKAARGIPAVLCGVHNSHLRGFTREEWLQLKALLRRMLANTEAHAGLALPAAEEEEA
ncbi:MarR family winged helix-turn-helix transcriptional regulator [Ramlibacter sp.]|uniref:MarR family winged helix-turn-helix transcriptional regulator n=1 Tax=Ramlibacter sp. TaxID=1917967 RepID=UPI003D0B3836